MVGDVTPDHLQRDPACLALPFGGQARPGQGRREVEIVMGRGTVSQFIQERRVLNRAVRIEQGQAAA